MGRRYRIHKDDGQPKCRVTTCSASCFRRAYTALVSASHINPINPGNDHLDWLDGNFEFAGIGRNMVADTHIASIAMEHDAEVHSRDSDFSRFPGLKWHDPLQ